MLRGMVKPSVTAPPAAAAVGLVGVDCLEEDGGAMALLGLEDMVRPEEEEGRRSSAVPDEGGGGAAPFCCWLLLPLSSLLLLLPFRRS